MGIKGRGNLCIKFAGGRRHIRQGRCNRSSSVQWRFIRYANRYIIQNRSGYVIDLYAYKRHNGAHIYAWNRKNGTNQHFYFIKMNARRAKRRGGKKPRGGRKGRKARGGKKPRGGKKNPSRKGGKGKPGRKGGRKGGKGKPGRKGGKGKGGKGKMKYRKNKTIKFMKGKYSFNLKTGRQFCQTKCANNKSSKEGVCFKNGVKKCKACSFTGNKTTPKGKESQQLFNCL